MGGYPPFGIPTRHSSHDICDDVIGDGTVLFGMVAIYNCMSSCDVEIACRGLTLWTS